MKMSLTSHWHLVKDKNKGLALLKKLKPGYVRVSTMQAEVMRPRDLDILYANGVQVLPICGSDIYGKISVKDWTNYCKKFTAALNPKVSVVQILNECNTARFTGCAPNSKLAWERYKIAAEIIKSRFLKIRLIAPGLTNENKSDGKTKISAISFIKDWINFGVDTKGYLDFWAMHFYATDERLSDILAGNIKYLKKYSKKPIVITETGSTTNVVGWYNKVKNGIMGVPPELIAWYCFNGHSEFELVRSNMTTTSLFDVMAKS